MSAARKLRPNSIFENIPEDELMVLYSQIYSTRVPMVGRCKDGTVMVFRPTQRSGSYVSFIGQYRLSSNLSPPPHEGTFSFTLDDTKYMFRGTLNKKNGRLGELILNTTLYRIQRRSVRRLRIPADYFGVVKVTHQNGRMIRSFGKLMDISPKGMGVFFPKDEMNVKVGDILKVILSISQRPPENVEMRVVHSRPMSKEDGQTKEKTDGIFIGSAYIPEYSISVFKRLNALVLDIYRDIFGSLSEPQ